MRILCNILVVLFVTTTAVGQQINPVPDYIFRNSMSVGRNAPTDTSAYFSIGPRFGATRGFMPPMVVDTAAVTGTKRNGLLIYSIQRNSFLYWDSTGSRWSRIAANLDTLLLSTKAWRQKGIDSVAALSRVGGSGTINRVPKFTASGTIGDGSIADSSSSVRLTILSGGNIGVATAAPAYNLDVAGSLRNTTNAFFNTSSGESYFGTSTDAGDYRVQIAGGLYNTTGALLAASSGSVGIRSAPNTWGSNYPALQMNNSAVYGNAQNDLFLSANFYTDGDGINRYMATDIAAALGLFEGNFIFFTTTSGTAGNQVTFTESMRFTSAGRLGIGTTSPSEALHVVGNIKTSGSIDIGGNNEISSSGRTVMNMGTSGTTRWYSSGGSTQIQFYPNNVLGMFIGDDNELKIAAASNTVDSGDYKLQVFGNTFTDGSITTSSPSSGSKKPWKLGEAATVSPTSPNRTIRVEIDGVVYYIHAKTTND
jgi:hypothetical protein